MKGRRHNTPLKVNPGKGNKAIEVYCDMKNGGWTLIQKRQDGAVDFYRSWNDYKNGFGSKDLSMSVSLSLAFTPNYLLLIDSVEDVHVSINQLIKIYIAPLQDSYSEALPTQAKRKRTVMRRWWN